MPTQCQAFVFLLLSVSRQSRLSLVLTSDQFVMPNGHMTFELITFVTRVDLERTPCFS